MAEPVEYSDNPHIRRLRYDGRRRRYAITMPLFAAIRHAATAATLMLPHTLLIDG